MRLLLGVVVTLAAVVALIAIAVPGAGDLFEERASTALSAAAGVDLVRPLAAVPGRTSRTRSTPSRGATSGPASGRRSGFVPVNSISLPTDGSYTHNTYLTLPLRYGLWGILALATLVIGLVITLSRGLLRGPAAAGVDPGGGADRAAAGHRHRRLPDPDLAVGRSSWGRSRAPSTRSPTPRPTTASGRPAGCRDGRDPRGGSVAARRARPTAGPRTSSPTSGRSATAGPPRSPPPTWRRASPPSRSASSPRPCSRATSGRPASPPSTTPWRGGCSSPRWPTSACARPRSTACRCARSRRPRWPARWWRCAW